jgi:hypothetical protein
MPTARRADARIVDRLAEPVHGSTDRFTRSCGGLRPGSYGQVGVAWAPADDLNPIIQDFVRCCLDGRTPRHGDTVT